MLALRDLEFDYRTGKVTDADYANLRAELLNKAAVLLEAKEKEKAKIDALLKMRIRSRRQRKLDFKTCSQCGTILEATDQFCHSCGFPVNVVCRQCGGNIYASDKFCSRCGTPVPTSGLAG